MGCCLAGNNKKNRVDWFWFKVYSFLNFNSVEFLLPGMAILITGGKGFVGSILVDFFKKTGRKIVLMEADITNKKEVLDFKSEESIEAIVHLAGVISGKNKEVFRRVNIEGTRNIMELGQKLQVKKIIFISSLRVLSLSGNPYIDSKREAEKIVAGSGLPYIILRPSLIYGPGDNKNLAFLLRLIKILPVVPIFNFRMRPIFVEDVVLAIAKCLDLPANQTINLAGGETISYHDLIELLKVRGYKIKSINAPRLFAVLLKFFSWLPFSPISSWQAKTLLADEVFVQDQWPSLLGIRETSFSDGLNRLLKNL